MTETTWYPFLECGPVADGTENFKVLGFSGHEALGEPYEYDILVMVSKGSNLEKDPDSFLDQQVQLAWKVADASKDGGIAKEIRRHGLLASVEEENTTGSDSCFRLHLVSSLWGLGRNPANRIFGSMNLRKQIETLLANKLPCDVTALPQAPAPPAAPQPAAPQPAAPKAVDPPARDPAAPLPAKGNLDWTRTYRCQHQETDLDFLHRHCERCGISYRIRQGGADAPETVVFLDGGNPEDTGSSIPFAAQSGLGGERLWRFSKRASSLPAKLTLRAYVLDNPSDFKDAVRDLEASRKRTGEVHALEGDFCSDQDEADALAKVRAQALECEADTWVGEGFISSLGVGDCFTLSGHSRKGVDGVSFRIVRMDIQMGNNGGQEGWPPQGSVTRLEAIPAARPFRPALRTPLPRMGGPLLAQVALPDDKKTAPRDAEVDAKDDPAQQGEQPAPRYAEVDAKGRCKVALAFGQSEKDDGKTVLTLPQLSPFGGPDHGLSLPLHPGADVLVMALNGDPDALVIAAALPTDRCAPQVNGNTRSQQRLKTKGNNQLFFSDVEGREAIGLQSPAGNSGFILGERRGAGPGCLMWSDGEGGRFLGGGSVDVVQGSSRVYRQGAEHASFLGGRDELTLGSSQLFTAGLRTEMVFGGKISMGAGFHLNHWEGSTLNMASQEMRLVAGDFLDGPLQKAFWRALPAAGLALAAQSIIVGAEEHGNASGYWASSFPAMEGSAKGLRPMLDSWSEPALTQATQGGLAVGLGWTLSKARKPLDGEWSDLRLHREGAFIHARRFLAEAHRITLYGLETEVVANKVHIGLRADPPDSLMPESHVAVYAGKSIALKLLNKDKPDIDMKDPNCLRAGVLLNQEGLELIAGDGADATQGRLLLRPKQLQADADILGLTAERFTLAAQMARLWAPQILIGDNEEAPKSYRTSTIHVTASDRIGIGIPKDQGPAMPPGQSGGKEDGSGLDSKHDGITPAPASRPPIVTGAGEDGPEASGATWRKGLEEIFGNLDRMTSEEAVDALEALLRRPEAKEGKDPPGGPFHRMPPATFAGAVGPDIGDYSAGLVFRREGTYFIGERFIIG